MSITAESTMQRLFDILIYSRSKYKNIRNIFS